MILYFAPFTDARKTKSTLHDLERFSLKKKKRTHYNIPFTLLEITHSICPPQPMSRARHPDYTRCTETSDILEILQKDRGEA